MFESVRLAGKRRIAPYVVCLALSAVGLVSAQQDRDVRPKVSDQPFTAEQIAVYRALLTSWYEGDKAAINLAIQTDPIDPNDDSFDKTCLKGLILEKMKAAEVHRFRSEDLTPLGFANLRFVDPEIQAKEVRDNDPGKAILDGKSVDDDVDNGIAHGLFTLGEIHFDKNHTHALVQYRSWCGMLCGHGSTMLLKKKDGVWMRKKQCGGWQS